MTTSEALVKYYDCLKDSFNKIQDKDNKTALINAALRPKIREEFVKSQAVLHSYLNYIQVFSLIYSDNFSTICNLIILPLLKENELDDYDDDDQNTGEENKNPKNDRAARIHETLETILTSSPELADDFVQTVVRVFPSLSKISDDGQDGFLIFLKNALKICTYLQGESRLILIAKIFDKLNPLPINLTESNEDEIEQRKISLIKSYEIIYDYLHRLNEQDLEEFAESTTTVFTREFISSSVNDHFKYLIFYLYSMNLKFTDLILDTLWKIFLDMTKPSSERRASAIYASSIISRANYVSLDQMIEYLEKACKWCNDIIEEHIDKSRTNEDLESTLNTLAQSIFYIITQRYREMYEEETITKLSKLNLAKIVDCPLRPLESGDSEIEKRFKEVSTLYRIVNLRKVDRDVSSHKRRKSDPRRARTVWIPIYQENGESIPDRIKPIYRTYFHHKFFTIRRDK